MATIHLVTTIAAPIERCFDLSRDLDLHMRTLEHTGERAVGGKTSGLIEMGETVTWEARHFGVRQRFTSLISAMERPRHFRDEMTAGAFRSFAHDHWFEARGGQTTMIDDVTFRSPLGPLGALADWAVMTRYLRRLLEARNVVIKREAESAEAPRL